MTSSPPGRSCRARSCTAVLAAEVMKLVISTTLCYTVDAKSSTPAFVAILYDEFVVNKNDFLKLTIPSILYTIQNSLQYFSMKMLSAPVFQVLYQVRERKRWKWSRG